MFNQTDTSVDIVCWVAGNSINLVNGLLQVPSLLPFVYYNCLQYEHKYTRMCCHMLYKAQPVAIKSSTLYPRINFPQSKNW